jgi:hypothetical protein
MNTHSDIYDRLRRCWSADTSSDPDQWEQANPAWGQCAVTACLVQDILGGDILWTMAICPDGREYSHYFNMLPIFKLNAVLLRIRVSAGWRRLPHSEWMSIAGSSSGDT